MGAAAATGEDDEDVTYHDGNANIVFTKGIGHTNFPPNEITLYFANNVIHLHNEY